MATSTDVPIYTNTLASTASEVTIDLTAYQGYKNLKIVMHSGATSHTNDFMRFNGDTTGSYSWTRMYSVPGSSRASNTTSVFVGDKFTLLDTVTTIYLHNYSNSSTYKTVTVKDASPNSAMQICTGTWRNTAPITSVTLFPSGASWLAGSTFSVYGIGSASTGAKATGGAIYSDADYIYHVFGSTSAFVPSQSLTADVLVVGGGGGGGIGTPNGNGGGGGFVTYMSNQSLTSGTIYTCTVGAGGPGRIYANTSRADSGGTSSFNSITAAGGTGGAASSTMTNAGGNSGSNINGTITNYYGGDTTAPNNQLLAGAGGAGAGANGLSKSDNPAVVGSIGGNGLTFSILNCIGPNTYVGGGGNGGNEGTGSNGGWGPYLGYVPTYRSLGGGGWGGGQPISNPANAPTNGAAMTGGGGGGATWDNTSPKDANAANGANGGSGVIIVRYAK
jgi:hypothetical protein